MNEDLNEDLLLKIKILELLPSVNFRNRLIVVNNRLISINRIDNEFKYDMPMVV